jgi:hypothetical protein
VEPEEAAIDRQQLGKSFMAKMNKRVKIVEDTVPQQGCFLLPPIILLKIRKLR